MEINSASGWAPARARLAGGRREDVDSVASDLFSAASALVGGLGSDGNGGSSAV